MKKISLILCFWFLGIGWIQSLQAQSRRYRLMWYEHPESQAVLGWESYPEAPVRQFLYLGTEDFGTDTSAYPFRIAASNVNYFKGMHTVLVHLYDLLPDTAYYFVVGDLLGTSARMYFETAPIDPGMRLSFIGGGDSRNNRVPRRNANRLVAKLRPHGVWFAGDFTDSGTDQQWAWWLDDWQYSISEDGRLSPIMPARGNHEPGNEDLQFLFGAPAQNYFAISFGQRLLRIYSLNTEISMGGDQRTWLEKDLTDHCDRRWKMAFYHKPIRPHVDGKAEGLAQYSYWAPLFYQHQVQLVLESDAHAVKSTWPIRPDLGDGTGEGFVRDDERGTVYVGEGCWGAPLRLANDAKSWTRDYDSFNQVKWIFVDSSKVEVRTVKVLSETETELIETLEAHNRFQMPANIRLWEPANGSVIELYPPETHLRIANPLDKSYFPDIQNIAIEAELNRALESGESISFLSDGLELGSQISSPFEFDWVPPSQGNYVLSAILKDASGQEKKSCLVRLQIGEPDQSVQHELGDCSDDAFEHGWEEIRRLSGPAVLETGDWMALRFQHVSLPKDAVILEAELHLQPVSDGTEWQALTVYGEAIDYATPFLNNPRDLSSRRKTNASVQWVGPTGLSKANGPLKLDVSDILREVSGRAGWNPGHALTFLLEANGHQSWHTCESHQPARLFLTYREPFQEKQVAFSYTKVRDWRNTFNEIYWRTDFERRIEYFVVKRARYARNYEPIHQVQSKGNAQMGFAYSVIDSFPYYGLSYYRIQAYDVDGGIHYSPVISYYHKALREVFVYPNPVKSGEKIQIELARLNADSLSISWFTASAQHLGKETIALKKERNIIQLNPPSRISGIYYLRMEWAGGVVVKKIAVIN